MTQQSRLTHPTLLAQPIRNYRRHKPNDFTRYFRRKKCPQNQAKECSAGSPHPAAGIGNCFAAGAETLFYFLLQRLFNLPKSSVCDRAIEAAPSALFLFFLYTWGVAPG